MNRSLRRLASSAFGFFSRVFAWYAILAFAIAMNHGIKAEAGLFKCGPPVQYGSGTYCPSNCGIIFTCYLNWSFTSGGQPIPYCTCGG